MSLCAPDRNEKELPSQIFWWEAPDASRILTFRITARLYRAHGSTRPSRSSQGRSRQTGGFRSQTMCFFGVGNRGGGPTRQRQIENVQS